MSGRKKVSRKTRSAARPSSRAKKKTTRKKVTKKASKKTAKKKVVRKKPTKAERKATRPTRRKPTANDSKELRELFPCATHTRNMTEEQKWELKMSFCRTYATRGIIRDACITSGISYKTYLRWRKHDEAFSEACEQAEHMANDLIEAEARRRAVEGYDRPVIYKGEVVDTYTDYSDSLMAMLLKGNKPQKYKERTEHSGSIGRPMTLEAEDKESIVSSILGMIKNKPDPDGGPQ